MKIFLIDNHYKTIWPIIVLVIYLKSATYFDWVNLKLITCSFGIEICSMLQVVKLLFTV